MKFSKHARLPLINNISLGYLTSTAEGMGMVSLINHSSIKNIH